MTRAWFRNSVRSFRSEKDRIARGMTDVDVGSSALLGSDFAGILRGREREGRLAIAYSLGYRITAPTKTEVHWSST